MFNNNIKNGGAYIAKALQGKTSLTKLRKFFKTEIGLNKLGNDNIVLLAEAIKDMPNLILLGVSYNEIGNAGAFALAKALPFTPYLRELCIL